MVEGEVGSRDSEIQQVTGSGEMEGAGLRTMSLSLGYEVGEVIRSEGLELQQLVPVCRFALFRGDKVKLIRGDMPLGDGLVRRPGCELVRGASRDDPEMAPRTSS